MANLITPQNLWSEMLKFKHLLGVKHGYTIPFLVGAYYKYGFIKENELLSSICIERLINNILESISPERPVKIFNCEYLEHELVLQYLATDLNEEEVQYLISWETNIDKKVYWHRMESDIVDYKSLIEWLWHKPTKRGEIPYGELISSKRFSCNFGCWRNFNEKEEKFIKHISVLNTVTNLNDLN